MENGRKIFGIEPGAFNTLSDTISNEEQFRKDLVATLSTMENEQPVLYAMVNEGLLSANGDEFDAAVLAVYVGYKLIPTHIKKIPIKNEHIDVMMQNMKDSIVPEPKLPLESSFNINLEWFGQKLGADSPGLALLYDLGETVAQGDDNLRSWFMSMLTSVLMPFYIMEEARQMEERFPA